MHRHAAGREGITLGKLIDMVGRQFGRLIVVEQEPNNRFGAVVWKCKCACGRWAYPTAGNLRSEHTQSCGCLVNDRARAATRLRPYESRYNALVGRCRGIRRIVMSYRDFVSFTKVKQCYYCGDAVQWNEYLGGGKAGCNLDRVDSRLGYIKRNCVVSCGVCNHMKWTLTQGEFFTRVAKIYRRNDER